ncbi:MAG TPA: DUF2752 domain-containing protein [Thermoanaerobaculia bacterium]|nr:DUF2752 domain-containing protein [Thermoanaerobaculia bacterium]
MTAGRIVSASIVAIAGAWVLYHYPPATSTFYPHCAFHDWTGLDCPGCGTTRALHELLHGRIGNAFRLNAMLFPLMLTGAFAAPDFLRGRTPAFIMKPWFGWGSFAVITAWWIGRNLW